ERQQGGAKSGVDRRTEVGARRSDAGGKAAESAGFELREELAVGAEVSILIRKADRIEGKIVVRGISRRDILGQAEVRGDRVWNAARSFIEDRRTDNRYSGDIPMRRGSRDLVRSTNIDHGLYAKGSKKALVRLGAGAAAAEEHSPTDILGLAARIRNSRIAANITEVEHTDLRHS